MLLSTLRRLVVCCALCAAATGLSAQYTVSAGYLNKVPVLSMPAVDNAAERSAELAQRRKGRPNVFAVTHDVRVRPAGEGLWLDEGNEQVWHLRIQSPGAHTLNLGFSEYRLPAGAELYISTPTERQGPFTATDNEEHNQFWTTVFDGDELLLELRVPTAQKGKEQLFLTAVNHDFMDVRKSLLSGSCNVDVVCDAADGLGIVDNYRDIIRSVAVYSLNGRLNCTGYLVNNTSQDARPLFMTAFHCGVNAANASSLVAYWNFENSTCRQPGSAASGSGGNGRLRTANSGATLLANYQPSDVTLTELDDPVNPAADVFFAGWDRRDALPTDTVIGIHHPNLEEKRISFSFNTINRIDRATDVNDPNGELLEVTSWSIGTTEPGSSGSPIFDRFHRIRGQLLGGSAACTNPDGFDVYGYFATSWEGGGSENTRIKDALDPCGTGAGFIDGLDDTRREFLVVAPDGNCLRFCNTPDFEQSTSLNIGPGYAAGTPVAIIDGNADLNATLSSSTVRGGDVLDVIIPGANRPSGVYALTVRVGTGANAFDVVLTLTLDGGVVPTITLGTPRNNATGVRTITDLTWTGVDGVDAYDVEVATDAGFSNVVASGATSRTTFTLSSALNASTRYFWRVRARGVCAGGDWTEASFTTSSLMCLIESATDLPANGDLRDVTTTTFDIEVTTALNLEEMEVDLEISHTYVGDLDASLIAPDGTTARLFLPAGGGSCSEDNLLLTFADNAVLTAGDLEDRCTNDAAYAQRGRFQPLDNFATTFANVNTVGTWTLSISDRASGDVGMLDFFDLNLCGDFTIATHEFAAGRRLDVFPNPTTDYVNVVATGNWTEAIRGTLHDATGRTLRTFRMNGIGRDRWDLGPVAAGVYYLRLRSGGEERTERLVVLR